MKLREITRNKNKNINLGKKKRLNFGFFGGLVITANYGDLFLEA
jgi:hypothetical protein